MKWLDCEVVNVAPPVCVGNPWPVQMEVVCRVLSPLLAPGATMNPTRSICMDLVPFAEQQWVLTARTSRDGLDFSTRISPTSCAFGRLPREAILTFRFKMPVAMPGILSITVVPAATVQQTTVSSICKAAADLPLATATSGAVFVAPSVAVGEELQGLFNSMTSIVAATQLQPTTEQPQSNHAQMQDSNSSTETQAEETAAIMCWCEHFHPLLQDLQLVLLCGCSNSVGSCSAAPISIGDPIELVFCRLLEYLAMHGCWCTVSYILSQAHKSALLQTTAVAAVAQQRQLNAIMQQGPAGLQTAAGLTASMILSLTAANQPGLTAAEELDVVAAKDLGSSSSKDTLHSCPPIPVDVASASTSSASGGHSPAAAHVTAGHSATATAAQQQMCRTKQTAHSTLALLLLVLLTAVVPVVQCVLLEAASPTIAVVSSISAATQLPMQYCALLTAVLLSMMGFSCWSGRHRR